jgi:hypothetical protein
VAEGLCCGSATRGAEKLGLQFSNLARPEDLPMPCYLRQSEWTKFTTFDGRLELRITLLRRPIQVVHFAKNVENAQTDPTRDPRIPRERKLRVLLLLA